MQFINVPLSAIVAVLCGAEKLLILSDIEGLYDGNPRENPYAQLIHRVDKIDDSIRALVGGAGSARGTGGMITKLEAAEIVTAQGIDMHIMHGRHPESIYGVLEGQDIGTLFVGKAE